MIARLPLLGAVLALLLGVAYFFLLHQPRSEEQAALGVETLSLQGQQGTLQAEIARLEQIRDDQGRFRADLDRLRQLVPDDVEQPSALSTLQRLADAAAVEITSLTFAEPEPLDPVVPVGVDQQLGAIAMTMTFEGTYFEALDFLRRVEQESDRAVLVRTLSVAEAEDEFPELVSSMTGEMFTLLPIAQQPAGALPSTSLPDAGTTPPPAGSDAAGSAVSVAP